MIVLFKPTLCSQHTLPIRSATYTLHITASVEIVHAHLHNPIIGILGFPRMPACEVTTYSHLAAAPFF